MFLKILTKILNMILYTAKESNIFHKNMHVEKIFKKGEKNMKKNLKKIFAFMLVATYSIFITSDLMANIYLAEKTVEVTYDSKHLLGNTTNASDNQIVNVGGENTSVWDEDGVKISKTIDGTDKEDYFDVTLQIKTKTDVKTIMESDSAAVVFVLDLSGTMESSINPLNPSSGKKIDNAIAAVQRFTQQFAAKSQNYPHNKIGAVGFNTDGHDVVSLRDITNYESFNTQLNTNAHNILNNATNYDEFTNIEAGIKKAEAMLDTSGSKHKYIVFLSDGAPTTYIKEGYSGYKFTNASTTFSDYTNGITGKRIEWDGANYSDTGAKRARIAAMNLKSSGVTIYSIGVGLQTFWGYKGNKKDTDNTIAYKSYQNYNLNGEQLLVNQLSRAITKNQQHVENKLDFVTSSTGANIWQNNTIRNNILNQDWEITKNFENAVNGSGPVTKYRSLKSNDYNGTKTDDLFKKWITYGIGSGEKYYYDVTKITDFTDSITSILETLEKDLEDKRSEIWKTTDPMTKYGTPTSEFIEFQGMFDKEGNLVQSLSGEHGLNKENTAIFTTTQSDPSGTISWDLKESGYVKQTEGNTNIYTYTLKYRIRLKVEKQGFDDTISYDSNGTTTLKYINQEIATKNIEYPIPKIKGFLENLKITKTVEGLAAGKSFTSANNSFTFTVNFKNSSNQGVSNTFTYDKYDASGNVIASNQSIRDGETFTLSNGEYIIIHKLYHDIKWSVTENSKDGFKSTITSVKPTSINKSGNTASATTVSKQDYEINYKNIAHQLILNKFDGDTNEKLEGVKFTLYSTLNPLGVPTNPVTNMNGEALENLETDSNGIIDLGNLSFKTGESTTYYLKEVDTIDKYNLLDTYIKVIVNEDGITASYDGQDFAGTNLSVKTKKSGNTIELNVPNIIGIYLPETGGHGSLFITLTGIILISYACIRYKKIKKQKN